MWAIPYLLCRKAMNKGLSILHDQLPFLGEHVLSTSANMTALVCNPHCPCNLVRCLCQNLSFAHRGYWLWSDWVFYVYFFIEHVRRLLPAWEWLCTKLLLLFYCWNVHVMRQRWTWGECWPFHQMYVECCVNNYKKLVRYSGEIASSHSDYMIACDSWSSVWVSYLYLWNISKTDMIHLVWEGVSNHCTKFFLKFSLLLCIPEVGHLMTYCPMNHFFCTRAPFR